MDKLKLVELKRRAKQKGLSGYSRLKKADLLSLLQSSKGSRRSPSRSPSRSHSRVTKHTNTFSGNKSLAINKYFSRIFIINLHDKLERFRKVTHQFRNKGVKYERFNAVDGRCKKGKCAQKKREMEKKYGVTIFNTVKPPTASLVIGTLEILKKQVKNKWKRVLICEDDVVFDPKILKNFEKGINELGDEDWDLLYLGCGSMCGSNGISNTKTKNVKYLTSLSIVDKDEYDWYVKHPDDLRVPLYEDDIDRSKWGKYISIPISPGGTWAYCYSLKGAKKTLELFKNKVNNHIDQMVIKQIRKNKIKAYSFDPPIILHEKGAFRPDSDIPWNW